MTGSENSLPIEHFVQALTTQLDRAQSAMAVKARNMKLPLTFAVKDLQLELRTHVEVVRSEVRIRPAGPGDRDASMLHLSLTTITRPMIEENAVESLAAPGEPTLKEALGDEITDEDERRLEWAGVNSVRQLRDLDRNKRSDVIQRVTQMPVDRLRAALRRASLPHVSGVTTETFANGNGPDKGSPRLRIRGRNLVGENQRAAVRIGGEEALIIEAAEHEILVAPLAHQTHSDLEIETDPGFVVAVKLAAPPEPPTGGPS